MSDMIQLGKYASDPKAQVVHLLGQPSPLPDEEVGFLDWRVLWQPATAHDEPCIAVKLTGASSWAASFEATNHQMVHIGVSDADGSVYSFHSDGILVETKGWDKCLMVPLSNYITTSQKDHDQALKKLAEAWQAQTYDPVDNNCFDFVVELLNNTEFNASSVWTKVDFVDKFLLPQWEAAAKRDRLLELLEQFKGGFAHRAYTGVSCTLSNKAKHVETSIDQETCPVCFDWQAWRRGLMAQGLSMGDDSMVDEEADWSNAGDAEWM